MDFDGLEKYTKKGLPWELVGMIECRDSIQAARIERKLKKSKNKKYVKWYFSQYGKILDR